MRKRAPADRMPCAPKSPPSRKKRKQVQSKQDIASTVFFYEVTPEPFDPADPPSPSLFSDLSIHDCWGVPALDHDLTSTLDNSSWLMPLDQQSREEPEACKERAEDPGGMLSAEISSTACTNKMQTEDPFVDPYSFLFADEPMYDLDDVLDVMNRETADIAPQLKENIHAIQPTPDPHSKHEPVAELTRARWRHVPDVSTSFTQCGMVPPPAAGQVHLGRVERPEDRSVAGRSLAGFRAPTADQKIKAKQLYGQELQKYTDYYHSKLQHRGVITDGM